MIMNVQKSTNADLSVSHVLTTQEIGVHVPVGEHVEQQFAMWVRSLMQNWRQGTVGVKGRSDVARSNKKPWKQKGTGRARAGSARSPLWRGGGVTFGPQVRSKMLSVPKNMKKQVLAHMLAERIAESKVIMLDWVLSGDRPRTGEAARMLKDVALHQKKLILLLPAHDMLHYASFANIPNVRILLFDQPNAYDLANGEYWIFLKKDFDLFKNTVGQWQ